VELAEIKLMQELEALKDEIRAKENVSGILESEIATLKKKEYDILQKFVRQNSIARRAMMESSRKVGVDKLKSRAEGYLQEKRSLEVKLDAKQNYAVRLDKEIKLNELRQQLSVLKEKMNNPSDSINEPELNKVLLIQHQQIERSIESVEKEIEKLTAEIEEKTKLYNADMKLAREQEQKLNKAEELENESKNPSFDKITDELESYREKLDKASTGEERKVIQKKIDELQMNYPEGVYEELISESNRTIKRVIVNRENQVQIYKMVIYNWGGTFYFRDGVSITKTEFDKETKY
jgi:DNA repair exonuclease SbcCD ATPase subunit